MSGTGVECVVETLLGLLGLLALLAALPFLGEARASIALDAYKELIRAMRHVAMAKAAARAFTEALRELRR